MKAERLDHIHIFVKDLAQATQFFSELLGTRFGDLGTEEGGLDLKAAIDPLGIELVEPISPDSPVTKFLEEKGEGLAGISFKVSNLEEAVSEFQSRGLRLIGRVHLGGLKEAQFHPKDCHGVLIELSEYEDQHGTVAAAHTKG